MFTRLHSAAAALVALVIGLGAADATAQRTVLVDIFTNSHCSPCRSMHTAMDTQVSGTPLADNVVAIYHHVRVYADDPLYQYNTVEPSMRGSFLGGVSGTPTAFIAGTRFTGSWSNLGPSIANATSQEAAYGITTSSRIVQRDGGEGADLRVNVMVTRIADNSEPVAMYGAVVEDVMYRGRNGVEDRRNVFRTGLTAAAGEPITFDENGMAEMEFTVAWDDVWQQGNVSAVVVVQSPESGTVYDATIQRVEAPTSVQEDHSSAPVTRVDVFDLTGRFVVTLGTGTQPMAEAPYTTQLAREHELRGAYIVQEHRGTSRVGRLVVLE